MEELKSKRQLEIDECRESIARYRQRIIDLPKSAKQINIWIEQLEIRIVDLENGGELDNE